MKKIGLLLISLILTSCGTGLKIRKENLQGIDKNFSGTYATVAHRSSDKYELLPSALDLFRIPSTDADFFTIEIEKGTGEMLVKYTDRDGRKNMHRFAGRFDKDMYYYEVYLEKQVIEIPPLIPIFFSKRHIERLRIGLNTDNTLIIDHKWAHMGGVLGFASGNSDRFQYFFIPKDPTLSPSHP